MKIRCDPSLKVLNKSEVSLWRTRLSHLQIALLVSQYFGKRHDEKKTLAEVFSKVKFQYCIDNEDHEILMMADYKEVIKGYTRTVGEITEEQQRDLIKIFEKRVAAEESQIRHDYFDMKKADKVERMVAFVSNPNTPQTEDTWLTCVYRLCKTLAVARQALFKVAQYGDTSIVHTFPPTSVKSKASAPGWSGPSNSAASASTRSTSDLVQQRSERQAYSTDPTEFQCCGFATHRVADCPFKGLHDVTVQDLVPHSYPP